MPTTNSNSRIKRYARIAGEVVSYHPDVAAVVSLKHLTNAGRKYRNGNTQGAKNKLKQAAWSAPYVKQTALVAKTIAYPYRYYKQLTTRLQTLENDKKRLAEEINALRQRKKTVENTSRYVKNRLEEIYENHARLVRQLSSNSA